jgi:hypothetical protein
VREDRKRRESDAIRSERSEAAAAAAEKAKQQTHTRHRRDQSERERHDRGRQEERGSGSREADRVTAERERERQRLHMLKRVDPDLKRTMLKLVTHADELDASTMYFSTPVTEFEAPGYSEIIHSPMDLSTIRAKINTRYYESACEVVEDVLLVYANCCLYNDTESAIGEDVLNQRGGFVSFCDDLGLKAAGLDAVRRLA